MSEKYVVEVSKDNENGYLIFAIIFVFIIGGGIGWIFSCENANITMSQYEITMSIDEVYVISASVDKKEAQLEWVVDDASIVQIVSYSENRCTIKAIKSGTTKIKASFKNSKDTCTINVIDSISTYNSSLKFKDKKLLNIYDIRRIQHEKISKKNVFSSSFSYDVLRIVWL